jgi:hypothetical protein
MDMADEQKEVSGTGSLTGESLEAEDVLAGAEPWEPVETKMVVWSLVCALIFLIIGLAVVPTSIFH